MVEKLSLDERVLNSNIRDAQRELARPNYNLYNAIKEKDTSCSGSPEASHVWRSIETLLGVYKSFCGVLNQNGYLQGDSKNKTKFTRMLSLYAGSTVSLEGLRKLNGHKKEMKGKYKIDFSNGDYTLTGDLIAAFLRGIKNADNENDLVSLTVDYLEWIAYEAEESSKDIRFKEFAEKAKELSIDVNGITISGFKCRHSSDNGKYEGSFEEIVGNRELVSSLKRNLEHVIGYNPKKKVNVAKETGDFPQTFLVDGLPGTGKTKTLKAIAAYGMQIAERDGIDFRVVSISNAIKSEFYSKSAQNLREQLSEVFKGDALYLVVIEDIDTIFYAREELNNRPEDKDLLGELMNLLEGISTSNLGNYMLVATTNSPLNIDNALAERLRQMQISATGPETPQDYIDLFKIFFRKGLEDYIHVSENDWEKIGEKCIEYSFSGRGVRNIALQIRDYCNNFDYPTGYYQMNPEEQKEVIKELYKKADGNFILEKIWGYHLYGLKKEQEEHQRRISFLKKQLAEQAEAYKQLEDGRSN